MKISKHTNFRTWGLAAVLGTAAVGHCAAGLNRAQSFLNARERQKAGNGVSNVRPGPGVLMLRTLSAVALALVFAGASDAGTQPPTIEPINVDTRNVGKCNIYDPNNPYGRSPLDPVGAIEMYVQSYQKSLLTDLKATDYSVKYVELPQHGTIKSIPKDSWLHDYYVPTAGYSGNDRYVAEVTVKGVKFRVAGYIRPSSDVMSDYDDICRRLGLPSAAWKISDAGDGSASPTVMSSTPASLLVALADLPRKMDDFAGGALGNTVGEGGSAQVTLDTTAAGHGWGLDSTPLDNSDDDPPTSHRKWVHRPWSLSGPFGQATTAAAAA